MVIREYRRVSGYVQGVGFRYRTKYAAEAVGVTGWVSNMWNGEVEMEVQGTPEQLDEMFRQILRARYIRVDNMTRREIPLEMNERGFHIR